VSWSTGGNLLLELTRHSLPSTEGCQRAGCDSPYPRLVRKQSHNLIVNYSPEFSQLAGLKGYTTNLAACPDGTQVTADFVIGSYHQLWRIEKSFQMSKHDLRARPIYHRKRESIDAHLSIVFAALAVTRFIKARTGWTIKRFVRTARRYRTVQIRAGQHILTAEDPLPDDLRDALALIR
jgi:hypothetical protein